MTVEIQKGRPCGSLVAPPSKSMAHRYLIAAALAQGESVVRHLSPSQDILATIDCLRALGAEIALEGETAYVKGVQVGEAPQGELPCRECGTTLRLMLPLCLLGGGVATLTGTEKLLSRPLGAYEDLCCERGYTFIKTSTSVHVEGCLTKGTYQLPGNVSSQYVSGLLYALACVTGESDIVLTTRVESRSYIDLTLRALATFGVTAFWTDEQTLHVVGGQTFIPQDVTVEGDWSNAAFWLALKSLGEDVFIDGLDEDSLQGDRVCREYFARLAQGTPVLSVGDCPDLAPVLMAVAALQRGAILTDTARLRLKESDRGVAMKEELEKCGASIVVEEHRIVITPAPLHAPSVRICSHNDHRIAMAMAVVLCRLGGTIEGAEAVGKSYPDFFEEMKKLGIEIKNGTKS